MLAGVVGFEPTLSLLSLVAESKSAALPLGYTPVYLGGDQCSLVESVRLELLFSLPRGVCKPLHFALDIGVPGEVRTRAPKIKSLVLYQLSYEDNWCQRRGSNPHGITTNGF